MKKDNLYLNLAGVETLCYEGTKSYDKEIIKMQLSSDVKAQYLKNILNPETADKFPIFVHCGRFHADDVFSTALILLARNTISNHTKGTLLYIDDIDINKYVYRVPNINMVVRDKLNEKGKPIKDSVNGVPNGKNVTEPYPRDKCIILDMLDGHYDHHHENQDYRNEFPIAMGRREKPNVCATFGALWSDIGHIFDIPNVSAPSKNVWEIMLKWIFPIDQQDNYGPYYILSPVSKIISNINGYSEFETVKNDADEKVEESTLDRKFIEAVKMAYVILRDEILSTQRLVQSTKDVFEKCKIVELFNDKGFYGKDEPHTVAAVDIAKVPENEKAPSIMMDAVNLSIVELNGKKVVPIMLINHNPNTDDRDKSLRVVFGRYSTIHVQKAKELMGNKIKFIHPNGGFLVTFENEENLLYFLLHFKECLDVDWKSMDRDVM